MTDPGSWDYDPTICLCTGVTEGKIVSAILAGARDLTAIREKCHANTQCGQCTDDILEILEETVSP